MRLSPLVTLWCGGIAAAAIALAIIGLTIAPPPQDMRALAFILGGNTLICLVGVTVANRGRLTVGWFGLRWTFVGLTLITLVIMLINIGLTAWLMFISPHDFALTGAMLFLAAAIALLSINFIVQTWLRRVRALTEAASSIAQGHFDTRIVEQGRDEIAALTRAFNNMAAMLHVIDADRAAIDRSRRDLVAWVSHDLRAPLAAARVMNEAILDGVVHDPDTVARYQRGIHNEIQRLSRLIDDLFALAQLDTGQVKLEREPTALKDLLSDTLGSLQAQADARDIRLTGEVPDNLPALLIAPDKIQRVLYNLLDNALRHTPPEGRIHLSAVCYPLYIEINVHNTGSVILPEDRKHIFTSFYRAAHSASESGRGTGMGLAIARGFVEAHGGALEVSSTAEGGTTFWFTLPLVDPPPKP